jgi:low temperature requirement protein LtrA
VTYPTAESGRLAPVTGDLAAPAGLSNLRRQVGGVQRASNIELFFDLVYVLAVTQLSDRLRTFGGAGHAAETAVLLAMVWLVWSYTMWVTNWLDPERLAIRLTLIAMMLVSLVMSAGLPEAFGSRGQWVGDSYAVMQIGRSAVAALGLRGDALEENFQRILVWCTASGALAVVGGLVHGQARVECWLAVVAIDVAGGSLGFPVPGLGRSSTLEWDIEGHHIAERCQAFILIALGESIVDIGQTLAELTHISHEQVVAFATAFLGAVALWWTYFDRSAEAATDVVVDSEDPGALGRSAYHLIHPIMVAGIIATAAADELLVAHPGGTVHARLAWLMLGGTGLFLIGHAAFKATVWHVLPWSRLTGVAVLAALGALTGHVSALTMAILAGAVAVVVASSDRLLYPPVEPAETPAAGL